jgi:UDP-2,3-diacylglucosamine pyrophosphatase LpxH
MTSLAPPEFNYRTVWISDIHLGTKGCQAEYLLDFLRVVECDDLYLVGDIIDIWRLKRAWYWEQTHNDVIQKLLRKARKGTRVHLISGNHDEKLRDFGRHEFGNVHLVEEAVHVGADGRRFLVIHGDQFDAVVRHSRWLVHLGDDAYQVLLLANGWINKARRAFGFPYWSLAAFLKNQTKNAVAYISNFEDLLSAEAKRRGLDGVICGHIHHAAIRSINGVLYCNDGDWVESCTALAEHADGTLEILDWCALRGLPRGVDARVRRGLVAALA